MQSMFVSLTLAGTCVNATFYGRVCKTEMANSKQRTPQQNNHPIWQMIQLRKWGLGRRSFRDARSDLFHFLVDQTVRRH